MSVCNSVKRTSDLKDVLRTSKSTHYYAIFLDFNVLCPSDYFRRSW